MRVVVSFVGFLAVLGQAQSIPFLQPDSFRAPIDCEVGTRLTRASTDRVEHAFVMFSGGRVNHDDYQARAMRFSGTGPVVMACQFADIAVPAAQSTKWLELVGVKDQVGDITVSRSAMTLFRVGDSDEGLSASRSGLTSEIRPLGDPTALRGGDIGFRFYGDKQEVVRGATFRAMHVESGKTTEMKSDEAGVARLTAVKPGTYKMMAFALEKNHLSIATLTFQVPGLTK